MHPPDRSLQGNKGNRVQKSASFRRTKLYSEYRQYTALEYQSLATLTWADCRCNRQIPASELLVKGEDVTRSTVQKAVVVLASRPVFVSLTSVHAKVP